MVSYARRRLSAIGMAVSTGPNRWHPTKPAAYGYTIGLPRSARYEAERSLECDLDTLRASACAAHLTGHRLRLRPRGAESSCRRRDPARRGLRRRAAARTAIG